MIAVSPPINAAAAGLELIIALSFIRLLLWLIERSSII